MRRQPINIRATFVAALLLGTTITMGQDSTSATEKSLLEQVYQNRIAMMQDSLFITRERLQAAEFLSSEINTRILAAQDSVSLMREQSMIWADSVRSLLIIIDGQKDEVGQHLKRLSALSDSLSLSFIREQSMSDLNDSLLVLLEQTQDFLASSGQSRETVRDSLQSLQSSLARLRSNMASNESVLSTQLARLQSSLVAQEGLSVDSVLEMKNIEFLNSLVEYSAKRTGFRRLLGGGDPGLARFKQDEIELYLAQTGQRGRADQILVMLADQYAQNGDESRAALQYLKVIFLYPDRSSWAVARTNIVGLIDRDSEEGYLLYNIALEPDSMEVSNDLMFRSLHYLDYLRNLTSETGLRWFIDECRLFLSLYPGVIQTDRIIFMMAEAYRQLEDYHLATLTFQKMVTLYPRSVHLADALLSLAKIASTDLDLPKIGVARYQEFLAQFPNSVDAPNAALEQAILYEEELLDFHTAGELFRKLADDYPDHPIAPISLFRYGALLERPLGSPSGATLVYLEILDSYGDDSDSGIPALKQLASIAMMLEQYDVAVVYLRDIPERYPESAEESVAAILAAAEIYRDDLDNIDAAIHTLHLILDNYPAYPGIKSVRKQVQKLQKKRG